MSPADAAKILDLPTDTTPEQIETRFLELRRKLEDKIAKAPTPGLQAKYRESLEEITTAFETLTLAADSASLPVTSKQTSGGPASLRAGSGDVGSPLAATSSTRSAQAPTLQSKPKSAEKEFRIVAVVAVVILAAGGWFVMKTRAEAAQAEAEFTRLRATQAELKIRWDTLEKEVSTAERRLAELKGDVRSSEKLPAPAQAELRARFAAQEDFVGWFQPYLARHPTRTLLAKLDAQLSSKALSAASATTTELIASLNTGEAELAAQRESRLTLTSAAEITSDPTGLPYTFTDAYGRVQQNRTPFTGRLPLGALEVAVTPPSGWSDFKKTYQVKRGQPLQVAAVFARGSLSINSTPAGLPYVAFNDTGYKVAGTTPADLKDVPTGKLEVQLTRLDWNIKATLTRNIPTDAKATPINYSFLPGTIEVTSTPAGAGVWENGKKIGVTPLTLSERIPGPFQALVRAPSHRTKSISGTVVIKDTLRLSAALEAIPEGEPAELGETRTIPGLALTLIGIPAGRYQRGSIHGEADEAPVHEVILGRGYWLGKTEVTQAQWQAIMATDPSIHKGADRPVEMVSWEEVREFCRKLTERERAAGRLPAGFAYTLPTEAQWEYACRAGTTGDYAGALDAMAWYDANSGGQTQPVGRKQANAWGFHDMHGNVWEWCFDWKGDYPSGSVFDPTGPESGQGRVVRGGPFSGSAALCRSANRLAASEARAYHFGFRLALSSVR